MDGAKTRWGYERTGKTGKVKRLAAAEAVLFLNLPLAQNSYISCKEVRKNYSSPAHTHRENGGRGGG